MTSRRDFIGLLAAAPVVGPMAAAAASAPRQLAYTEIYSLSGIGDIRWGRSPVETCLIRRMDGGQVRFTSEPEVPNRLHGAYINEDGDAA